MVFTCFSGQFKLLSLVLFVNNCFAYSLSTTIDCLDDLNLFLASSRADKNNFQYSDTDLKKNLNDNYINQVILTNLKNCVYTDFLNFDSRVDVFNSLFMLHFNIRSLQKTLTLFMKFCSCFRLFPKLLEFPKQKLMILLLLIFLYLIIHFYMLILLSVQVVLVYIF